MYGTQAGTAITGTSTTFENDVKMYGTQARKIGIPHWHEFETDVKMYGIQCSYNCLKLCVSLVKR